MWFFFTSGTTGKASVLTHGQMGFVVVNHVADLMPGLSHESGSLVVAPLSHGAGMHMFVNAARAANRAAIRRTTGCGRGVAAGRGTSPGQYVHGADHCENDDGTSGGGSIRPYITAGSSMPVHRCIARINSPSNSDPCWFSISDWVVTGVSRFYPAFPFH